MKPYFLWISLGLSVLLHGLLFFIFSGRSFYGFQQNRLDKEEVETVSINLLNPSEKKAVQDQLTQTETKPISQSLALENFAKASHETLEKTLAFSSSSRFSPSITSKGIGVNLFGASSEGFRFVYLLDVSGSMREKVDKNSTRLSLAKLEIQRSLQALPETAEFNILLFADRVDSFSSECVPATSLMKARAFAFLEKETFLSGITDISGGLGVSLAQWPDVIFLMTDGVSNLSEEAFRSQWQYLYHQSKSRSQINVIGFLLNEQQESLLREITTFTKGKFLHWKD